MNKLQEKNTCSVFGIIQVFHIKFGQEFSFRFIPIIYFMMDGWEV